MEESSQSLARDTSTWLNPLETHRRNAKKVNGRVPQRCAMDRRAVRRTAEISRTLGLGQRCSRRIMGEVQGDKGKNRIVSVSCESGADPPCTARHTPDVIQSST